jgi:hypothetical protein
VANVRIVVAAATALQSYGEMLETLVEDTQTKELHSAAEKFASSVKQVPNVTLSQGASDAISAVIVLGGRMLIETKKAHAIKKIVPQTKPAIDQICDTLTRDFDFTKAVLRPTSTRRLKRSTARRRSHFKIHRRWAMSRGRRLGALGIPAGSSVLNSGRLRRGRDLGTDLLRGGLIRRRTPPWPMRWATSRSRTSRALPGRPRRSSPPSRNCRSKRASCSSGSRF